MNILVVAPAIPGLEGIDTEISSIASLHRVEMLHGEVREADIRAATKQSYEVVWFATHGNQNGLLLSGNEFLPIHAVAGYVASVRPRLVLLNSCTSVEIAAAIQEASPGTDVIATISEVPDKDAARVGVLFARELAKLSDFRMAYERVKPAGARNYIYLGNPSSRRAVDDERHSDPVDDNERLVQRLIHLIEAFQRDMFDWKSSMDTQVALLQQAVSRLESQVEMVMPLARDLDVLKVRMEARPRNGTMTMVLLSSTVVLLIIIAALLFASMLGS